MSEQTIDVVREYYGQVLKSTDDLKTSACCADESPPEHIRALLGNVHDDVQARFYGCGSPLPLALEGCTVLDLGCGSGRDVYLLSQLVGPSGRVIGIDMTDELLSVAETYKSWHMERFGFAEANVSFLHGYIEELAGIEDASVDVIVSNCVINLSPDKAAVFKQVMRVLKPGGEIYFSDVFAGRRVPDALQVDPVLLGECLSGALYTEDFRRILRAEGVLDYREIVSRRLSIDDPVIEVKIGMIDFYSKTIRAFKVPLEDICENYGHVAYYRGTIADSPHAFMLDNHHLFRTGMPVPVCGNTANMLSESRFGQHFTVVGDFAAHYGPFDCTAPVEASSPEAATGGACC